MSERAMVERQGTIASRLLTLNLLLVLPVVFISLALATATYHVAVREIETEQVRTVDEYALRSRIWLRGVLRSIEIAVDGVSSHIGSSEECAPFAQSILRTSPVYKALQIKGPSGVECFSAEDGAPGVAFVRRVMDQQRARPIQQSWAGNTLGAFRYDSAEHNGRTYLVVYQRNSTPGSQGAEAVLLVTAELLDLVFELGNLDPSAIVGLVVRPSAILAARGSMETKNFWLPRLWTAGSGRGRWMELNDQEETFTYVARELAGPDLAVIARFDRLREGQAWVQFVILSITPLAMLGLLFLLYWRYIKTQVLRGIASVERAALAEANGRRGATIPVDDMMPSDIRSVAEAFNRMVRTVEEREDGLRRALAANVALMKELHHRVKNSLQVIQSFMTLTRRQYTGDAARLLAVAEARVEVLAVAYRHGLTEHGLRDIEIAAFLSEIASSSVEVANTLGKQLEFRVTTDKSISVDKAVPLGLAIAEIVHRRLEWVSGGTTVVVQDRDDGCIELAIIADSEDVSAEPETRILSGFKTQLRAIDSPLGPGEVLRWQLFC